MRRILPYLALILLILLCFHKLAFTDSIIPRGDTYVYFYPYWAARDDALRSGHIPLWTPNLFMGAPMLADPQVGVLYPPNWLTIHLSAPNAIRVSILLHEAWMALGMYWLAQRWLGVMPSVLAAALFAFGGHVGGHVEQINQLQGLAWLPWAFLALDATMRDWRRVPLLALVMALQVLCGHTQTVFITGVGLAIYGMLSHQSSVFSFQLNAFAVSFLPRWLKSLFPLMLLALAAAGALLLALPQLAPTLELIGLSNRQDGLSQQGATAFSLSPLVVGRALLPNYDTPLFGEFIAYIGIVGIGLALLGVMYGPRQQMLAWGVLAVIGFGFALGFYNPLYQMLAGLPGFNFFRVPARWLALFAFAIALLDGCGLQALLDGKRPHALILLFIVSVVAGLTALAFLTPYAPEADDVPGLSAPSLKALLAWGAALAAFVGLQVWNRRAAKFNESVMKQRAASRHLPVYALFLLALVEIVAAASVQAYNDLSARDAYDARRFTVSQLQALSMDETVAGRLLSISDLLFDPGDRAALEARYQVLGMSEFAVRNAFIDIKLNEILSPNQPLRWDLPTVDGFGGGLVPTAYYTWFASLVTPTGQPAVDGRLREALALPAECRGGCIPEQRWLDLMGVRYLIVDKVFDFWHDGVAYDTAFEMRLTAGQTHTPNYPMFEATALDVLYAGETAPLLVVNGQALQGEALRPLDPTAPSLEGFQLVRFTFEARGTEFGMFEAQGETRIRAITLVDARVREVFQQVVIDNGWRLALSSDVKVYERIEPLPRAFMVSQVINVPDDDSSVNAALQLMGTAAFDPRTTAVIATDDVLAQGSGTATITHYEAERVEITVNAAQAGTLVLAEAWYPGWRVWVNGVETPVYRANVMFRAVQVPAGESTIVFTFAPTAYPQALLVSAAAWSALGLWGLWMLFTLKNSPVKQGITE